jgi:hypothetical protein
MDDAGKRESKKNETNYRRRPRKRERARETFFAAPNAAAAV